MPEEIKKNPWKEMLKSKKFWYAIAGVIVAVVAAVQPDWAEHVEKIIYTIIALILGQGLADIAMPNKKEGQ